MCVQAKHDTVNDMALTYAAGLLPQLKCTIVTPYRVLSLLLAHLRTVVLVWQSVDFYMLLALPWLLLYFASCTWHGLHQQLNYLCTPSASMYCAYYYYLHLLSWLLLAPECALPLFLSCNQKVRAPSRKLCRR